MLLLNLDKKIIKIKPQKTKAVTHNRFKTTFLTCFEGCLLQLEFCLHLSSLFLSASFYAHLSPVHTQDGLLSLFHCGKK